MKNMTVREAAEVAGVSVQAVHKWLRKFGPFFGFRERGRWLVNPLALARYMKGLPVNEVPESSDLSRWLREAADALDRYDGPVFAQRLHRVITEIRASTQTQEITEAYSRDGHGDRAHGAGSHVSPA